MAPPLPFGWIDRGQGGSDRPRPAGPHRGRSRAPPCPRHRGRRAGVGGPRQGLLYAYPDRAAFEAEALAWRLRRENGVRWLELDSDELRQREPSLDRRYTFGILVEEGAHCRDPGAYVAALASYAETLGLKTADREGYGIPHSRVASCRPSRRTRATSRPTRRSSVPVPGQPSSPGRPATPSRWKRNAATTSRSPRPRWNCASR